MCIKELAGNTTHSINGNSFLHEILTQRQRYVDYMYMYVRYSVEASDIFYIYLNEKVAKKSKFRPN